MSASESAAAQLATQRHMHALRLHERGGPERLVYEPAPVPPVGVGDALVRVRSASITPTELDWQPTWEDRAGRDRRPVIPAHEAAGVVAALGYGATGVAIGDAVYALTDWYRDGAAAEYVAVEARDLAPLPATLSFEQAAAVPLAGLTAWQALFDHGHLAAGQTALILGAGGGVGSFAVQLAHGAGAHVVGTGRAWARQVVMDLGADVFIDLEREALDGGRAGAADVVFDLVGGDLLRSAWAVVKPGGVLVSAVADPQASGGARPGARSVFFVVVPDRAELIALARQIEAGMVQPIVGRVEPLAKGRAAFEAKHTPGVPGKIVLAVSEE
jgi:NADPH:quinone reductase-like Zn-dependent oxidoreductase